jgi:hypothetical protein
MAALAALAALTMLSVQGCDTGTAAQATPHATHDLTIAAAQAAYQAYLTNSDQSAASATRTTGLADVSDAQWEIVHAQYSALASADIPVPRYQYGSPDFYVPALTGYPRWFAVSVPRRPLGGSATSNADVTTLMVFEKAKPSSVWTLDGTAALQPGQSLPAITRDSAGYATALATHDQNLLLPPDVVGATHAAVVDDGPASAAAAVIAPGPQTTGLHAQQSAYASAQKASGLAYTWLMQGASFPVFALRLADGGALVLYGVYLNTTNEHLNLIPGPPIPVPANFTPLLAARTEIGYHAVYANWTYQFAAIDPPATAHNQKLSVIAGTGGPSYGHAY